MTTPKVVGFAMTRRDEHSPWTTERARQQACLPLANRVIVAVMESRDPERPWLLSPPLGAEIVETPMSRWWLESGVLCCQRTGSTLVTADDVRAGFRVAFSLTGGRKAPLIAEARHATASTREARDVLATEAANVYLALAVVVGSPVARTLMNFFLRFSSPAYPARCFNSATEARVWAGRHVSRPNSDHD